MLNGVDELRNAAGCGGGRRGTQNFFPFGLQCVSFLGILGIVVVRGSHGLLFGCNCLYPSASRSDPTSNEVWLVAFTSEKD